MEGNSFFRAKITPRLISDFIFDLQRFTFTAADTAPEGALFSVKKTEEGITKTYYGTDNSDFKTNNLKDAIDIQILGNIQLQNDIGTSESPITQDITVANDATLDLNGKTLYTGAQIGIKIANKKTFTVKDTSSEKNGTINNSFGTIDKINYAAVMVGDISVTDEDKKEYNPRNATFIMEGGNITSKNSAICVPDGSNVEIKSGNVTSTGGLAVFFGNYGHGGGSLTMSGGHLKSTSKEATIQVTGNRINKETKIDISGGTIEYAPSEAVSDKQGNKMAIYCSGTGNVTISNDARIVSSYVGIEIRAGKLNIEGGTIAANSKINEDDEIVQTPSTGDVAADKILFTKTKDVNGSSFSGGVAIAVSQHSTAKNVDVNISGGEISGYAALAIANPGNNSASGTQIDSLNPLTNGSHNGEPVTENGVTIYKVGEVTVDITGGTLISTSDASEDKITPGDNNGTYTIVGRNAIFNGDSRVTVNISNATVNGSIAATTTGRNGSTYPSGYNIGTGNEFSNFVYDSTTDQKLVSFYNVNGSTDNFSVNVLGGNKGWNKDTYKDKNWVYLVENQTTSTNVATLAPDDSASTTALKLTTANDAAATIKLSLSSDFFIKDIFDYTTLDASTAESKYALDITGNSRLKEIKGGAGNDTLTASAFGDGTTLDGGEGQNLLVGATGKADVFVAKGIDTISGYEADRDTIQFESDPTNVEVVDSNLKFTVGENSVVVENAAGTEIAIKIGDTTKTFAPVAQIGDTNYYTLSEAISKATDGQTVKLLVDSSDDVILSADETRSITLDLNGKNITGTLGVSENGTGTLTLNDTNLEVKMTKGKINLSSSAIKLLEDVTGAITVNKSLSLDLNGKKLTGTTDGNPITVSTKGDLTVMDSASDGQIINENATGSAVQNNGTFNLKSGEILSLFYGINNIAAGSQSKIFGGLIRANTAIRMLAGNLNVLAGKVRGLGTTRLNEILGITTQQVENVIEPAAITDASSQGIGIDVSGGSNDVNVTVGGDEDGNKTNTAADIEITGTGSALEINDGSGTGGKSTVNLYDGTYSNASDDGKTDSDNMGSAIAYNSSNSSNKLTVNGAILESKMTVSESAKVGMEDKTGNTTNNIVLTSVAINTKAIDEMTSDSNTNKENDKKVTELLSSTNEVLEELKFGKESETQTAYNFTGARNNFYAVKVTTSGTASASSTNSAVVEPFDTTDVEYYYKSLKEGTQSGLKEGDVLTLMKNCTIDDTPITISASIKMEFGGYKITSNLATPLSVAADKTLTIDTESGIEGAGIEVGRGAKVQVAAATEGGTSSAYGLVQLTVASGASSSLFSQFATGMDWLGSNTLIFFKNDSREDGILSYAGSTLASAGKAFTLNGIGSTSGIAINGASSIIDLKASNFTDATIVDGGNYKFNLSGESTSAKTFTGSANADDITNAIKSLTINGGAGADSITNSGESVAIYGDGDNDSIINTGKNASLFGGDGADTLSAGNSGAYLDGGAGNDSLSGGSGADTFVFNGGTDTIGGYSTGDVVQLTSDFKPVTNGKNISTVLGGFALNFGGENSLQFNTVEATPVVTLNSGGTSYFYTSQA